MTGIGNNTGFVGYSTVDALTTTINLIDTFYIEYNTAVLPAGSYNVTVYWMGVGDFSGANIIYIPATSTVDYSRTLLVQEISA